MLPAHYGTTNKFLIPSSGELNLSRN